MESSFARLGSSIWPVGSFSGMFSILFSFFHDHTRSNDSGNSVISLIPAFRGAFIKCGAGSQGIASRSPIRILRSIKQHAIISLTPPVSHTSSLPGSAERHHR